MTARTSIDPACHPVPVPTDPARAAGRWTESAVREILKNRKYTGHMVWNRRSTKRGGKVNPVTDWVLSAEPTHPAIVSPEEFAALPQPVLHTLCEAFRIRITYDHETRRAHHYA